MAIKLPEALLLDLKTLGIDINLFTEVHHLASPPISIRKNPNKSYPDDSLCKRVPWSDNGFYLPQRPSFTLDPLFHAGCYYVQEASSMFIEHIFKHLYENQNEGGKAVLDLCASPGGKSTILASLLHKDDLLISNEVIKSRVSTLVYNLNKWGNINTIVSNNDPKDFATLKQFFDCILVDAPCSGSGLFRKDPNSIQEWSVENVSMCSQRQERIISNIIPSLKNNGYLIYSTCSYSKSENEEILDFLIEHCDLESVTIPYNKNWNIIETFSDKYHAQGFRFYPHLLDGEGFFTACLRKKSNDSTTSKLHSKKIDFASRNEINSLSPFINNSDEAFIFKHLDCFYALPKSQQRNFETLSQYLYIKKSGTRLGEFKGKDFIPDHQLALSPILPENVSNIDLDLEQALEYLRLNPIHINNSKIGWNTVSFQFQHLGWIKTLPNRINNYLPKDLRIHSK